MPIGAGVFGKWFTHVNCLKSSSIIHGLFIVLIPAHHTLPCPTKIGINFERFSIRSLTHFARIPPLSILALHQNWSLSLSISFHTRMTCVWERVSVGVGECLLVVSVWPSPEPQKFERKQEERAACRMSDHSFSSLARHHKCLLLRLHRPRLHRHQRQRWVIAHPTTTQLLIRVFKVSESIVLRKS